MSRATIYVFVVLTWLAGLAFLAGLGWLLDRWVAPGILKTGLNAVLIALAITLFGVTPREALRALGNRQARSASESGAES